MPRSTPLRPGIAVAAALLVLAACGGSGGDSGPGPSPLAVVKATGGSGDGQVGDAGDMLKEPLRVLITRDGEPVNDVDVDWEAANGGSTDPASSSSNASGIAETFWTLGPGVGAQSATAVVDGADGSPITFSATAESPGGGGATVQVLSSPSTQFNPANVNITVGQSVTWVWPAGSTGHNVSPVGTAPTRSGNLSSGPKQYVYTFNTAGVYQYYCEAHGNPNGTGMFGTVTVAAAVR
jgi:plastocyanin